MSFLQIQMQEECDPAYSYRGPSGALKVIRGRGCEESFRAAVDKHIVDPNHQTEISNCSCGENFFRTDLFDFKVPKNIGCWTGQRKTKEKSTVSIT